MTNQSPMMKRVLKTPALVVFGLAYMVPLGIFTTYRPVTVLSHGHLPIAYIITLITMIFTALSYCHMTRNLPLSGSAYSYVQYTFGGQFGFLVGWVQVLDYLFLPILNYIVLGNYLHELFPFISISSFILICLISVSVLNFIGVKLMSSVNFTLIGAQVIFIIVFIILALTDVDVSPEKLLAPLLFSHNDISGLFSGAAILALAFLGFDAIATLAEESNDAKRTLPRAILWTVCLSGLMFLLVSYSAHIAYPDWILLADMTDPKANILIMDTVGNHSVWYAKWFTDNPDILHAVQKCSDYFLGGAFLWLYLFGVFASAMTSNASVSRIFFAMGRDGVLPKKIFYKVHSRFHTPYRAILIVSLVSLLSLIIPLELVISMISFGALGAFTFVNLSVIKYFIFNKNYRDPKSLMIYGVMPAIGILFCLWLWTSLDFLAIKVGLLWLLIGFLYLLYLTNMFKKPTPKVQEEQINELIQ